MKYSAPLDGIRAIAILAVLLFHIAPAYLPGGFTGVDVFFVLSGFLITSIILGDIRGGSFSLKEFYLRRIQRIVPNITLSVSAATLLSSWILLPSSSKKVALHGLYTLINLSNFFILRNFGGYWGDAAESSPLLHTWSLAVEEQFYLLLPVSLMLLARFQGSRVTRWLTIAGSLSFAACVWATPRFPLTAFYMLPTRFWELLLGGALASLQMPLQGGDPGSSPSAFAVRVRSAAARPGFQELSGWIGLCLIGAGLFAINGASGFPGVAALLPTVGTAFLIVSAGGKTRVSLWLSMPAMVWIGRLSYSLYLWHWPFITLAKFIARVHGQPQTAWALGGALASFACAWLAYVLVEQPLRSRGPGRRARLATIAAGFVVTMAGMAWAANAPYVDITRYFDRPEFYGLLYDAGQVSTDDVSKAARYRDVFFPPPDGHADQSWRSGGIVHLHGSDAPKVVTLGSSHALMYSHMIDGVCRSMGLSVAFLGADDTQVFFGAAGSSANTLEFDAARKRWLSSWRPQAVFVIERWDSYHDFASRFRSLLEEVSPLAKTVIFVAQPPVLQIGGDAVNLCELGAWRMMRDGAFPRLFPDRSEPEHKKAISIADAGRADFANLRVLRPDLAFYSTDGSVRWFSGRTMFYVDDDHLSDAGSEAVRGLFASALAEAVSAGHNAELPGGAARKPHEELAAARAGRPGGRPQTRGAAPPTTHYRGAGYSSGGRSAAGFSNLVHL